MVLGLGCDIVRIIRLNKWLKNHNLLHRYFTQKEILSVKSTENHHRKMEILAGIFASKEAFKKAVGALGIGGIALKDIGVEKQINGAPRLHLERSAAKAMAKCSAKYAQISISHEKKYCIATVIIGR